jgi:hypothetical protein
MVDGGRRLNSAHPRWWRLDDLRPWMTLRLDGLGDPDLRPWMTLTPRPWMTLTSRAWMRSAGGDGGGGVVVAAAVGARIQKN